MFPEQTINARISFLGFRKKFVDVSDDSWKIDASDIRDIWRRAS